MANKHRFAYNRKNRKLYYIICTATDATNARNGNKVVVYSDADGNVFVRDVAEFQEKFNYVNKPYEEV